MNPDEEFRAFLEGLGFEPPARIEPGRFSRFATNGKRGDQAGWALLFPDAVGGICGDHRTGERHVWQARRHAARSAAELRAWRERIEMGQRTAANEREQRHNDAADRALEVWKATATVPDDHQYLVTKGVKAHGLRLYQGDLQIGGMLCDGALVVPARNASGVLSTLEFIAPSGEKRFLPGGRKAGTYFGIGKPNGTICIAEGFATGATIYQSTGHATAVAFDAGNLMWVALELRKKFRSTRLIVCADNDLERE